ncbi:Gfo/Idh/MocA family protein [Salipiger profundus]|uniref:Gfo/Idh/MocA family protein n=1 Tax=Salipiger profundus TaxID=1229727 RepID=UPI0008EDCB48|nr:Gfo/Idh/MocA family oxidoreductase [Salipiger profundus]SFC15464.1 Predicted dehydrogenase [Salipiger profundus]
MNTRSPSLALLGGAHVHLPDHLYRIDEGGRRVSHVFDRDPARKQELCDRLGAEPLETLDSLDGLDVSGVVVCSETTHHEADITAALKASLPVFSEKPLAGSARAAQAVASLAEEHDLLLQTGYFFRTIPALRAARDWIDHGRLGRVSAARMLFSHDGGYADWLDLGGWMTDPERACYGGFVDEAVHAIDALQWMLGPIDSGHAVTGNALGWPVDDHGASVLRFDCGAAGVVEAGWTDTRMRLELDIVGDEAAISLRDSELVLTPRGATTPIERIRLETLDAGTGILPFLAALDGETKPGLVPPRDAARVNTVLDALDLRLT